MSDFHTVIKSYPTSNGNANTVCNESILTPSIEIDPRIIERFVGPLYEPLEAFLWLVANATERHGNLFLEVSQKDLAEVWNWSQSRVRRFLRQLVMTQVMTQDVTQQEDTYLFVKSGLWKRKNFESDSTYDSRNDSRNDSTTGGQLDLIEKSSTYDLKPEISGAEGSSKEKENKENKEEKERKVIQKKEREETKETKEKEKYTPWGFAPEVEQPRSPDGSLSPNGSHIFSNGCFSQNENTETLTPNCAAPLSLKHPSPNAPKNLIRKHEELEDIFHNGTVYLGMHAQLALQAEFGVIWYAHMTSEMEEYAINHPDKWGKYRDHSLVFRSWYRRARSNGYQEYDHPENGKGIYSANAIRALSNGRR